MPFCICENDFRERLLTQRPDDVLDRVGVRRAASGERRAASGERILVATERSLAAHAAQDLHSSDER